MITPADLNIPQTEIDQSQDWLRAMSINEWKALEAKYNVPSFLRDRWKTIHEIWKKEHSFGDGQTPNV